MIETIVSTKTRILDAAEHLFADHGFQGTSLRRITSEAGVNLAAVNYHFQSKEALLHAIYERRAGPINRRRLDLLDAIEAGGEYDVARILDAFVRPVFELGSEVGHVPRLMMRLLYVETEGMFQHVFERHFRPTFLRFAAALRRATPHLSDQQLMLRMQFFIGSFAHVMASGRVLKVVLKDGLDAVPRELIMRRLIRFAAAGIQAPEEEEA
jgi:AcrR family transcriptional regulator